MSQNRKNKAKSGGKKLALARWQDPKLLRMAKSAEIPNCEMVTNKELNAAMEKIF